MAHDAQPGIYRVGLALPRPARALSGAFSLGYGYTEPQEEDDSGHHRQLARLAAAFWPTEWLGVSARLDQRYDYHCPDPGQAHGDDGWLFEPTFGLRAAWHAAPSIDVGPDLGLRIFGTNSARTSLEAATPEARLLGTWSFDRLLAGVAVGYRLDRSSRAGQDAARMSDDDRMALGLSDFDAVLVGAGVGYCPGNTSLEAEIGADLLVGSRAPPISQSPLRAAVVAGHTLGPVLAIQTVFEVSLSSRPPREAGAPLVPVEPRLAALVGLRYSPAPPSRAPARPTPSPRPSVPTPRPPPVPAQAVASPVPVELSLTDEQGQPIANATVTLEVEGRSYPLLADAPGRYQVPAVPPGEARLHIEAPGFVTTDQPVELGQHPVKLELRLMASLPAGQIRGLVRSFQARPLRARIRIEPLGVETTTDEEGWFQIDVQPGEYEVVIEATGFVTQRRHVRVRERGVVVLNADLLESKR